MYCVIILIVYSGLNHIYFMYLTCMLETQYSKKQNCFPQTSCTNFDILGPELFKC